MCFLSVFPWSILLVLRTLELSGIQRWEIKTIHWLPILSTSNLYKLCLSGAAPLSTGAHHSGWNKARLERRQGDHWQAEGEEISSHHLSSGTYGRITSTVMLDQLICCRAWPWPRTLELSSIWSVQPWLRRDWKQFLMRPSEQSCVLFQKSTKRKDAKCCNFEQGVQQWIQFTKSEIPIKWLKLRRDYILFDSWFSSKAESFHNKSNIKCARKCQSSLKRPCLGEIHSTIDYKN